MSRLELNRRKFVAAAGTASALVLAGCADEGSGDEADEMENGEEPASDGEENDSMDDDGGETYTLTVTVEDENGEPAEGATVTLEEANTSDDEMEDGETGEGNETSEDDDAMGDDDNETESGEDDGTGGEDETGEEDETDENGEVEFEGLEDGEYTVTAEHEGQEAEEDVEIDGDDEEVTLTLGEGGETTGAGEDE